MTDPTDEPWAIEDAEEGMVIRADDPDRPGKRVIICTIGPAHRTAKQERRAAANAALIAQAPRLRRILADFVEANPDSFMAAEARAVLDDCRWRNNSPEDTSLS